MVKTFGDFQQITPVSTDFLVGYRGTTEIRTTADSLSTSFGIDVLNSGYTTTQQNSATWNSTYTTLNTNSGRYESVYTNNFINSGYWADTRNNVVFAKSLSANAASGWIYLGGSVVGGDSNNKATGASSHAEGGFNIASGGYSHVEGASNTASGNYSHAEGSGNTASGTNSHAEGSGNTASGTNSHAEGSTTRARGAASHAEGNAATATGNYSHAAGSYVEAVHDRTWIWQGTTATSVVSTTRTDQFLVSAAGGIFFPGNVGIGTDNNTNALTVNGTISATAVVVGGNNLTNVNVVSTNSTTITIDSSNYATYLNQILHVRSASNTRINFESSLPTGFNTMVLNESTSNVTLTSTTVNTYLSFGSVLSGQQGTKQLYSSATVYKYGSNVYAVGALV